MAHVAVGTAASRAALCRTQRQKVLMSNVPKVPVLPREKKHIPSAVLGKEVISLLYYVKQHFSCSTSFINIVSEIIFLMGNHGSLHKAAALSFNSVC